MFVATAQPTRNSNFHRASRWAMVWVVSLALAGVALAQDTILGWGKMPHHALQQVGGNGETVDASSLNFTFSIPIVAKPGRAGLAFALNRVYNSTIFKLHLDGSGNKSFQSIGMDPEGWTTNIRGDLYWNQYTATCTFNGTPENYTVYRDFRFHDPSGTAHFFSPVLSTHNDCNAGSSTATAYSMDGFKLYLWSYTSWQAWGPDGTFFGWQSMEDSNGNEITWTTPERLGNRLHRHHRTACREDNHEHKLREPG